MDHCGDCTPKATEDDETKDDLGVNYPCITIYFCPLRCGREREKDASKSLSQCSIRYASKPFVLIREPEKGHQSSSLQNVDFLRRAANGIIWWRRHTIYVFHPICSQELHSLSHPPFQLQTMSSWNGLRPERKEKKLNRRSMNGATSNVRKLFFQFRHHVPDFRLPSGS